MNFDKWIQQAYGVKPDNGVIRFTVYNMQVAYEAGKTEGSQDRYIKALHEKIKELENEIEYLHSELAGDSW